MKFEVFIPGKAEDDFDITLKIKANSWLEALKSGLSRLGEDSELMKHIMIDIKDDNSFHITETLHHRVFRIKEIIEEPKVVVEPKMVVDNSKVEAEEPKVVVDNSKVEAEEPKVVVDNSKVEAEEPKVVVDNSKVEAEEPKVVVDNSKVEAEEPKVVVDEPKVVINELKAEKPLYKKFDLNKKVEPKKEVNTSTTLSNRKDTKAEPKKDVNTSTTLSNRKDTKAEPKKEKSASVEIEDIIKSPTKKITLGRKKEVNKNIDDILEEIYFDISIIDTEKDIVKAMNYIIDFSLRYVNCESGTTYLIDMDRNDFWFAAIRGPKADLLRSLNLRIPVGVGMAGFAMHENLTLAISDVNRDPRYYKSISDKLGYPTYSMVTIPMHANGRVYGAIQLINKKDNNSFTIGEINILDYIATHAAKYLDRKFNILNDFS